MLLGRYIFSCVFLDDAVLPDYKGSTFRGVFGHALKKVVCAMKRQDCRDCLLKTHCVYAFVFEGASALPENQSASALKPALDVEPSIPSTRQRIAAQPHPYVIEPFNSRRNHYVKGEPFDFTLLLFGKANDYMPYFIYAMHEMGRLGIGKAVARRTASDQPGKAKAAFALREVRAEGRPVYSAEEGKIQAGPFTQEIQATTPNAGHRSGCTSATIHLQTPLRLKYENRLNAELPFHVLVRAMLRRVSSLCLYYGDGEPALDYRGLVDRAQAIKTAESTLRWYDWKRYSNRQDQAMLMGGMIGSVFYAGELDEFIPLIRFCEKVHLGKQTAFGLGKIVMNK